MRASSVSMKFLVTDATTGLMAKPMKANGRETKCMVKESLNGKTENAMMASLKMIRGKAKGTSHGPMADNIQADGKAANSTEKAFTLAKREIKETENGKMAEKLDG